MSIRSKFKQSQHMKSATTGNKVANKLPILHRSALKSDKKKLVKLVKVKKVLDSNTMIRSTIQQPTNLSVDTSAGIASDTSEQEERELETEAIRLILLETQRAKERVDTMGAIGWSQNTIPRINKQFARQTVSSALAANIYNNKEKEKEKKL